MSSQANTKVNVDLPLFTASDAFGHIDGSMCFSSVPSVGDTIPFGHPESNGADELIGTVRVETLLHADDVTDPMLMLSDVYVGTKYDAFRVARYLEDRFGLFAIIYCEDDLREYMGQEQDPDR